MLACLRASSFWAHLDQHAKASGEGVGGWGEGVVGAPGQLGLLPQKSSWVDTSRPFDPEEIVWIVVCMAGACLGHKRPSCTPALFGATTDTHAGDVQFRRDGGQEEGTGQAPHHHHRHAAPEGIQIGGPSGMPHRHSQRRHHRARQPEGYDDPSLAPGLTTTRVRCTLLSCPAMVWAVHGWPSSWILLTTAFSLKNHSTVKISFAE